MKQTDIQRTSSPMPEFETDEVISILLSVKPKPERKPQKQKSSINLKEPN